MKFFTDHEIEDILQGNLDRICFIAYEGFLKQGRGMISLGESEGEIKAMFVTIKEGRIADPRDLNMVNTYNPEEAIVLQYATAPGKSRSMRLDLVGDHSPKSIWDKFNVD